LERFYRLISSLIPVNCQNIDEEVLFHASSIGEINALYPLIKKFPSYKLSVFTKWGYEYARSLGLNVIRFPFDNPECLRKILRGVRMVIIAETEIWPNLIITAKDMGIKVFIVNGTVGERAFKVYKKLGLFRRAISALDLVLCQSEEDERKFKEMGARNVEVFGNLKFDSVERPIKDIKFERFKVENSFIFANIRGKEIKDVVKAIRFSMERLGNLSFIIAPRHLENVRKIERELKRAGIDFSLRTKEGESKVLILDTLGELWSIYRFGKGCFVGGSLYDYGGHSLIEPAYWKLPTAVGPYLHKQPYAWDMVKDGAVYLVRNWEELGGFLLRVYSDPSFAENLSSRIYGFYLKNRGVVDRVYERINLWR